MDDELQSLFEAVRQACSAGSWSRGVELVRADAVTGDRVGDDEAVFDVSLRGGMISATVRLFADDADWECSCGSHDEACEHVAGAVIGWRRAREAGKALPGSDRVGRIEYHFSVVEGVLALERRIVAAGTTHVLETSLAAVAEGRVGGPRFSASQSDLAVELALGTHRHGVLARPLIAKLFPPLARCSRILLDGKPVEVSPEPVSPVVRVEDSGEGFRLSLVDAPGIVRTFSNGVAYCDGRLRPVVDAPLTGRELHDLATGRNYSHADVGELVTRVLPALKKRTAVEVLTKRLPTGSEEFRPRVQIDVSREGETLSLQASLVYGDPPCARLEGDRLVHLGGAMPVRDIEGERRLIRRLRRELHLVPGIRANLTGTEAVSMNGKLDGWTKSLAGAGREFFRLLPPLVPRIELEGTRWDVAFESVEGPGRRCGVGDSQRVLEAWRSGESLVPLLEGGWAPLPADWLERYGERVADLLEARAADGTLPRAAIPDLVRLYDDLNEPAPPNLRSLESALRDFTALPRADLPSDLTAELRGYQREGVDWLVFLREAGLGALLADDMGLGKTLQALCALRGRTLVVAPTSVLHNWIEEANRFRPALRCCRYHGPRRSLDGGADLTLTTYAILRLDADILAAEEWDTVVLDEAQAIKNPESQVAEAAFRLDAKARMTLTGTPVENRLDELWSQFHFLNRGLLGGRRSFRARYSAPIAAGTPGAAQRLRERIRPFVLRRMKREVAPELPPRTESVLHCELTSEERDVYDTIRAASIREVVRKLKAGAGVMDALEVLLRLRQAACHPGLIPGRSAESSSKVALLLDVLDSVLAEGHRALVFSQWTSLLDLLEPHLKAAEIGFGRLDGSTRDRAGVVREFQADSGPPILLISLKAGGTGLNLTAADHVFLLDLWWNPAVEDQAADRAHRIGQHRPVMIYRLIAEGTVEERILELQRTKRELADAALGDAEQAPSLNRDDLLRLLE